MKRPLWRRAARITTALLFGTALIVLLLEVVLRIVLFSDLAGDFGRGLRKPQYYADRDAHDDFWKLLYRFSEPERRRPTAGPDPLLGWLGYLVAPSTYEHADEGRVGERRPVLLYGDSFAQCNTPAEQCFQTLLEQSDLGRDHALVNYGVGGYGLDQIWLLLEHTLDRWAGRDPLVIVSLLVESDLDRSYLSMRDWPKPRLQPAGDALASEPVETDIEEYLESHPLSIRSYLWHLLAYRRDLLSPALQARLRGDGAEIVEAKRELNRRILEEIHDSLSRRGFEHVVLLFHVEEALRPDPAWPWQEPLVLETCAELGMPVISTREFLLAASGGDVAAASRFYGHSGLALGHLNAIGNVVATAALREAIEGRANSPSVDRVAREAAQGVLGERFTRTLRHKVAGRELVAEERGVPPLLLWADSTDGALVRVRCGELGPTRLTLPTAGATRLRARARAITPPGCYCRGGPPWLAVELAGAEALRLNLLPGSAELALDLDLGQAEALTIVAGFDGFDADCAWIEIEALRLE